LCQISFQPVGLQLANHPFADKFATFGCCVDPKLSEKVVVFLKAGNDPFESSTHLPNGILPQQRGTACTQFNANEL